MVVGVVVPLRMERAHEWTWMGRRINAARNTDFHFADGFDYIDNCPGFLGTRRAVRRR